MRLRCKLCGKLLSRSVEEFMEHLLRTHNLEFVCRSEQYFFDFVDSEVDSEDNRG
jgi:hypothetical protein